MSAVSETKCEACGIRFGGLRSVCPRCGHHPGRRKVQPQDHLVHGTHARYTQGCRCDECKAGHAEYNKQKRRKERQEMNDIWALVKANRAKREAS